MLSEDVVDDGSRVCRRVKEDTFGRINNLTESEEQNNLTPNAKQLNPIISLCRNKGPKLTYLSQR